MKTNLFHLSPASPSVAATCPRTPSSPHASTKGKYIVTRAPRSRTCVLQSQRDCALQPRAKGGNRRAAAIPSAFSERQQQIPDVPNLETSPPLQPTLDHAAGQPVVRPAVPLLLWPLAVVIMALVGLIASPFVLTFIGAKAFTYARRKLLSLTPGSMPSFADSLAPARNYLLLLLLALAPVLLHAADTNTTSPLFHGTRPPRQTKI